jgi:hypothetical protein
MSGQAEEVTLSRSLTDRILTLTGQDHERGAQEAAGPHLTCAPLPGRAHCQHFLTRQRPRNINARTERSSGEASTTRAVLSSMTSLLHRNEPAGKQYGIADLTWIE